MMRALLLVALACLPVPAQDGGDELARKLVERIQQDLAEVDRLLDAAATAEAVTPLQDARSAHVRAISDLEELIRQVKYRRGSSSSSSGGGGGGSSGGQQQPQRGADGRDQAGSASSPQEQQRPSGDPQGREPQPADERGERLGEEAATQATEAGRQVDGQQPPPQPVGDFLRRDTDARWGVLPPKLQERLMNLHADDVPERYRTWLEAYVRELSRREAADGAR